MYVRSASMRMVPVVNRTLGVVRRFDGNRGKPTGRPARLPARESDQLPGARGQCVRAGVVRILGTLGLPRGYFALDGFSGRPQCRQLPADRRRQFLACHAIGTFGVYSRDEQ